MSVVALEAGPVPLVPEARKPDAGFRARAAAEQPDRARPEADAQDRADAFLEQAKQSLPEDLPQDIYDTYIQAADFIGRRDF